MSPLPERMSSHWWWRPGVRPGRRLLVWHVLLDDQPRVRALIRECQDRLAGMAELDLIPIEWLHMTTQIVGFDDEVNETERTEMIEAVDKRLRLLDPITVEIGKPLFHSEAVVLGVRPARALDPVREAIRDAIARTVAVHQLADEPTWTPHVSIAYSNSDGPAAPIIQAFGPWPSPQRLTVRRIDLVAQVRVGHLYRWEGIAAGQMGR